MEIIATNENFAGIIAENSVVMVDFWATLVWTMPRSRSNGRGDSS
jgi:hypothetical protein